MVKHLLKLVSVLNEYELYGDTNIEVTDVSSDSRDVQKGGLFIALRGINTDGHKYIDDVVKSGVKVLMVDTLPKKLPDGIAVILVSDTRLAMEQIVPYFFDYPGKKLRMIGVTGTNGKTTTTNIIYSILNKAGHKAGLIGTINIVIGDRNETSHNTTPDVVDLQKTLYAMVENGCDCCVMEVSSHALALGRVAGIEFDCAVLTNITQDHLDFHKTMEEYRDAKSLLFEGLNSGSKKNKISVFNMDDASSGVIRSRISVPSVTLGMNVVYDYHPVNVELGVRGMRLRLVTPYGSMDLNPKVTGEFNVYNLMCAVAVLQSEGVENKIIETELNRFTGVPGRFQLVDAGQKFSVIVDYAHTPDGLENVLKTARKICDGNLWVIFGCGGDRDNSKRPIMGEIALDLADKIVVTSDNPRTEDPEKILDQICSVFGLKDLERVTRIADRKKAIESVLSNAKNNDVVLIAGKGHENYQILKDKTIHFDDCEVVKEFFKFK